MKISHLGFNYSKQLILNLDKRSVSGKASRCSTVIFSRISKVMRAILFYVFKILINISLLITKVSSILQFIISISLFAKRKHIKISMPAITFVQYKIIIRTTSSIQMFVHRDTKRCTKVHYIFTSFALQFII